MKENKCKHHLNELRAHLTVRKVGCEIQYEYLISSTQTLAHEWARLGAPEGAVVIAEGQEEGRGRSGKHWCSPVGTGIWMSLILRPPISIRDATHFTLMASVAVQKGIQSVVDLPIQIKWPNDLLINGKKVCGILTEVRSSRNQLLYMVIGLGINVNTLYADFPQDIREIATSLLIESGKELSRPLLLAAILNEMECCYTGYLKRGFEGIKEEWEARSGILGKSVKAQTPQGRVTGEALSLTNKGELLIQTRRGKVAINAPYIELS